MPDDELAALNEGVNQNLDDAQTLLNKLPKTYTLSDADRSLWQTSQRQLAAYASSTRQVAIISKVDRIFVVPFLASADQNFTALNATLENLAASSRADSDNDYATILAQNNNAQWAIGLISLFALTAALALSNGRTIAPSSANRSSG